MLWNANLVVIVNITINLFIIIINITISLFIIIINITISLFTTVVNLDARQVMSAPRPDIATSPRRRGSMHRRP